MIRQYSQSLGQSIKRVAQGPLGRILILLGFACFFYLAFYPFEWDPPVYQKNGAEFLPNGNLEFREAGIAFEKKQPDWVAPAMETGSMILELRVRAFTVNPGLPDRIISLSMDQNADNFMVGQDRDILFVQLSDPNNLETGGLDFKIPGVFEPNTWRTVVVLITPESMEVRVDGRELQKESLSEENLLKRWDRSFQLAFGNEHIGRRPWLGEISEARLQTGGREYDLLRSPTLQLPNTFWNARFAPKLTSIMNTQLDPVLAIDYAANFLCFIPLGFLITVRKKTRWPVLLSVVYCALASLGVEIGQVFFNHCFPSIYDWILNTSGAMAGAILAGRLITAGDPLKKTY